MSAKLIQVKMRDHTVAQADKLIENMHAASRSDAIRKAIELSELLTDAVKHGDKIILEGKRGKRELLITGISNG